jgi:hypothetical protein
MTRHSTDLSTPPMSTSPDRPTARPAGKPGFGSTLASEWSKLWSLPFTFKTIAIVLLLTFGVSVGIIFFGGGAQVAPEQADGKYSVLFFGSGLGTWAFVFLTSGFMSTEFRSGMVDYTFITTPKRLNVLWAKLLVVAGLGFVGGAVTSLVTVGIAQATLLAAGFAPLQLADPGLHRAVLLYVGLGWAVQGLLGALAAVFIRHNFGSWALAVGVSVLPVAFADVFGDFYAQNIPRWTPGAAVESLAGLATPDSDGYLPLPMAALSVAAWLCLFGIFAVRRLVRGDAR